MSRLRRRGAAEVDADADAISGCWALIKAAARQERTSQICEARCRAHKNLESKTETESELTNGKVKQ